MKFEDFEDVIQIGPRLEVGLAPPLLQLCFNGIPIGHIYFHFSGELAELCDLEIRDDLLLPSSSVLGRLLGKKRRTSFRGRGFGSALLKFFIEHAKRNGMRRIEGKMVGKDMLPQPQLPNWYHKRGFSVSVSPDHKSGTISLDLEKVLIRS
jgi:hypothetical protein